MHTAVVRHVHQQQQQQLHTLCPPALCALRLWLSMAIFEVPPFPLSARVLLVMMMDSVDCRMHPSVALTERTPAYCSTYQYQRADKLCDLAVYAYLLVRTLRGAFAHSRLQQLILVGLFAFRVVGSVLFLKYPQHGRVWFTRFPDVFREVLLFFSVLHDLRIKNVPPALLLGVVAVLCGAKWCVEHSFHMSRE